MHVNAHLIQIFSYLNIRDTATCCQVSSKWRQLASENILWVGPAQQLMGEVPSVFNVKSFLQDAYAHKLESNEEIITYIEAFADRVSLGHNASFTCILVANRRKLEVVIKGVDAPANYEPIEIDLSERCVAIQGIVNVGKLVTQVEQPSSTMVRGTAHDSSNYTFRTILEVGPFWATVIFPSLLSITQTSRTDMENKIITILQKKLVSLSNQLIAQRTQGYSKEDLVMDGYLL